MWQVCESDLEMAPSWDDPEGTPPPLHMHDAVGASKSELAKYFPDVEIWDLEDIALHRIGRKWFYVVSWRARGTTGDDLGIPVLMNGKAMELKTR
jgi:hypothetical protein